MWTSLVVVALLAAGCFSAGSSPTQDTVSLVSDSTLSADGPDVQTVSVRAVQRDGRLVYIDELHVVGRTADGDAVDVEPVVAAASFAAGDEGEQQDEFAYEFAVNVADLVQQGVTSLEMSFRSAMLRLPVEPGAGQEEEGGDEHLWDDDLPWEDALPGETDDWETEEGLEWNLVAGPDVEVEDEVEEIPGVSAEIAPLDVPLDDPGTGTVAALARAPQRVQVRTLRRGTSQATPVYIIRSARSGPTVMVVGGVHGSETAGWRAAEEIRNWRIDRGTLVVVPRANMPAVRRNRRTGPDGIDLNRQFPVGRTPRTALAREIWNLVREFRPVALMDLHEGWGVRRLGHRFPGGTRSVGQTLISHTVKDSRRFASYAVRYLNTYHTGRSRTYQFMIIGPPTAGSLARKAGSELGIPSFIVEPTQYRTTLATRIRWHKAFVQQLLRWYGLVDRNRVLVSTPVSRWAA